MKMVSLTTMLLAAFMTACTETTEQQLFQIPITEIAGSDLPDTLSINFSETPKMFSDEANPLLDFMFCADPTATVYNGRMYVYGTNDHQQYENAEKNDYGKIKSLVMMSSADMVNWTFHGTIDVGEIAPWIVNAWAPSVVYKKSYDGSTTFYLYFSNNGTGTAVLTSKSPFGPWSDPLGTNLVGSGMGDLDEGIAPFDPGAVIDDNGTGWLSFGGGTSNNGGTEYMPLASRIVKLNDDMISFASDFITPKAPSFNEASELNYINGTWVYTFCNRWNINDTWPASSDKPGNCSMCYMTSTDPLNADSWTYRGEYLRNPGETVPPGCNNHSHLQKFKGKYYLLYHSMYLQSYFGTDGGFRNIAAEEINVDEDNVTISPVAASRMGVSQIENLNPFISQQAETVAATYNAKFEASDELGNMYVCGTNDYSCLKVRGINFTKQPDKFKAKVNGTGGIDVHIDSPTGPIIAQLRFGQGSFATLSTDVTYNVNGVHDLYFIIGGETARFDEWSFTR